MKKNGMTLPEIMITVVIIGIISAILIPMANKAKPDETKIAFLKNYDELTRAVKELASNSRVYPISQTINANTENEHTFCFEKFPLLNTETRADSGITAGNKKFCELLAFQYDVEEAECSADTPAENGTARGDSGSFLKSFTAKTGEDYRILTNRADLTVGANGSFISEILIDVNGDGKGPDCMYNAKKCEYPDTFRFWVTADGNIVASDVAGQYYLKTRENTKEKSIVATGIKVIKPKSIKSKDISEEDLKCN